MSNVRLVGRNRLGEQYIEASKMRDEYEKEGGFTSSAWADDAVRYRNELSDPVKRAVIFAMQALYQRELNFTDFVPGGEGASQVRHLVLSDVLYYESDRYIKDLTTRIFDGVNSHLSEIDALLQKHITCNWQVERLAAVERNLLRIGIFGLLFDEEAARTTSDKAIINCCSDLSEEYSTERSKNFVFGVLSEVSKDKNNNQEAEAAEQTEDQVEDTQEEAKQEA
ncbi:MAG: transcription antitermination protein NusB [Candidatus Bruticola sp.]